MHASRAEDAKVSAKLIKSVAANLEISGKYSQRGWGGEGSQCPSRSRSTPFLVWFLLSMADRLIQRKSGGAEKKAKYSSYVLITFNEPL